MRKIKMQELSRDAFHEYGDFVNITEPSGNSMGDFYNDKIIFPITQSRPIAFSPLVLHAAERMIVTKVEYHDTTGEGIVVMDDDIVLHVAPPTAVPVPHLTQSFRIPKGTMVTLKTGVWHNGGFPLNKERAHVLIILPERIYNTDCTVFEYKEEDQILIEK